jgi:hypothetical protein
MAAEEATLANFAFNGFPELYDSNAGNHYVYHDASEGAVVKREMIHKVRNGEFKNIYAVKRVPRRINDETRRYINELTKND